MKTQSSIQYSEPGVQISGVLFALVLVFALACSFARAQTNYTVEWYSVDGGGGTSTGGVFYVSGTVGQPDSGSMSGESFSLVGGFWSVVAIQTPSAPYLSVAVTNANMVVVSWPLSDAGWKLQSTTDLANTGGMWVDHPPPYQTNGVSLQYIEPALIAKKFYRLKNP